MLLYLVAERALLSLALNTRDKPNVQCKTKQEDSLSGHWQDASMEKGVDASSCHFILLA
jgi:hypothetical protein